MPRRRTMTEKIDVIRRLLAGQSIRGINRETGIHRATIRIVRDIAFSRNWLNAQEDLPCEKKIIDTLQRAVSPGSTDSTHILDIYQSDIEGWLKEGESLSQRQVSGDISTGDSPNIIDPRQCLGTLSPGRFWRLTSGTSALFTMISRGETARLGSSPPASVTVGTPTAR